MGDPKRRRKKFERPNHPWIGQRIVSERELKKEHGLKNKKEIWKLESKLKNYKDQVKKLIALKTEQSDKEMKLLLQKLSKLGLATADSSPDDVLALTIDGMMERRLQNIVVKMKLAHSPKQARQFITHRHIIVNGRKITSPNYIVSTEEEATVSFAENSPIANPEHPERFVEKLTPEEQSEVAPEKPKPSKHKKAKKAEDGKAVNEGEESEETEVIEEIEEIIDPEEIKDVKEIKDLKEKKDVKEVKEE